MPFSQNHEQHITLPLHPSSSTTFGSSSNHVAYDVGYGSTPIWASTAVAPRDTEWTPNAVDGIPSGYYYCGDEYENPMQHEGITYNGFHPQHPTSMPMDEDAGEQTNQTWQARHNTY